MLFLTTRPLWLSALVMVGAAALLSGAGPFIIRRRVGLDRLRTNNEVAGFKFATVGVLYAVLLGFAVIVVWEKYSSAEADVAQEAGAAAATFRMAAGLDAASAAATRQALSRYLTVTIAEDWPAMERGTESAAATRSLDALYAVVLTPPRGGTWGGEAPGAAVAAEILRQLDVMTQARRSRLLLAAGIVPGVIWLVLFGGAALTIGFTLFFGTANIAAQTLMTGMLAALICLGLLVIVAIDHPFAGTVRVGPEALAAVMEDFSQPNPVSGPYQN